MTEPTEPTDDVTPEFVEDTMRELEEGLDTLILVYNEHNDCEHDDYAALGAVGLLIEMAMSDQVTINLLLTLAVRRIAKHAKETTEPSLLTDH